MRPDSHRTTFQIAHSKIILHTRILLLANLSLRNEDKIKIVPDKLSAREIVSSRLSLQEILQEVIRLEADDSKWQSEHTRENKEYQ